MFGFDGSRRGLVDVQLDGAERHVRQRILSDQRYPPGHVPGCRSVQGDVGG